MIRPNGSVLVRGAELPCYVLDKDPERRLLPDMPSCSLSGAYLCVWPQERYLHFHTGSVGFDLVILDEDAFALEVHRLRPRCNKGITTVQPVRRALVLPLGSLRRKARRGDRARFSFPGNSAAGKPMPQVLVGGFPISVEIAYTSAQLMRGLMFRNRINQDEGMLFPFTGLRGVDSFWMRNTFVPLDVAYFGSRGRLLKVLSLEPAIDPEKDGWRVRAESPGPYEAVLEVRKGWFREQRFVDGNGQPIGECELDLSQLKGGHVNGPIRSSLVVR